jgi:hypothetical protein
MQRKLLGFSYVDFDAIGQLQIIYSALVKYLRKKLENKEAVHQLIIDFKKAYDSVRREGLYNILIDFGIPMNMVRLMKMSLTETYSRVCVGKNLSDMIPIRKVF